MAGQGSDKIFIFQAFGVPPSREGDIVFMFLLVKRRQCEIDARPERGRCRKQETVFANARKSSSLDLVLNFV